MKRHAYLILAHNQVEILKLLLNRLDVPENDIYIHLDLKSDIKIEDLKTEVKNAKIFFADRISIQWGGYSIVEAMIKLLEISLNSEHIYYHFLSGVDLPLKDIREINAFYELHTGKQFIRFFSKDKAKLEYNARFGYKSYFRDKFGKTRNVWAILNRIGLILQKIIRKYDNSLENDFYIGSQFCDITEELARELVDNKKFFEKLYRFSSCSDEIFIQTYIFGTKYMKDLWIPYSYNDTGMMSNMRFIDFSNEYKGSPHTINDSDIELLIESNLNFARKFDIKNISAIKLLNCKLEE